jgi:hypothetical protein
VKLKRLLGAAVAGVALSATMSAPASAEVLATMDFAVRDGDVEMVVFGSGNHVDSVTITSIGDFQGPAEYQFTYWASTGPNKSDTLICGGGGTGDRCHRKFNIDATYASGVSIRSCGSITRVDSNKNFGTACKNW